MSNSTQTSAKDRIYNLLDENTFVEIGAMVTKRNTDFNLQEKSVPADGVVTGYGMIDGNLVYVYSQDAAALGGTIGEMHAKKIAHLYDFALKVGAPVIGLIDCAGIRLQEGLDALAGFGEIYLKQTLASGVIPQISAVFGSCGGGAAVSGNLSDFTFMEAKNAKLFINAPNALDGNYVEKCDTAAADFQAKAGVVDFVCEDEETVLSQIRELITILPLNNEDDASFSECTDDLNRLTEELETKIADPEKVLTDISDNGFFMEVKKDYAQEMVTGFIRLNGMTVGAVANRSAILDDSYKAVEEFKPVLTTAGCYKAVQFVSFCDAFQIPVLTLTNVAGYEATIKEEKSLAIASAKLTYTLANATVPKVNVITEKAFGSAYITMNSKHIGADLVFAFENAKIGMMDAKSAAEIMYADEISAAADKTAIVNEKAAEYSELQNSVEAAAKRGYVDNVIAPGSVRKQLIYAFEMLFTKREGRPDKKHGTV